MMGAVKVKFLYPTFNTLTISDKVINASTSATQVCLSISTKLLIKNSGTYGTEM